MKTALLLIDIQNDYFDNGSNPLVESLSASLNAQQVLVYFREKGLPVVHVRHESTRPTATFFLPGTVGAEIHQHVRPIEGEKVVVKHFPNAFRETDLLDWLKSIGVNHLVICGMMTHMCVDATTRAAKDAGFECVLVGDACATKSLEYRGKVVQAVEVHAGFLAALSYYYASIKSTTELLEELVLSEDV